MSNQYPFILDTSLDIAMEYLDYYYRTHPARKENLNFLHMFEYWIVFFWNFHMYRHSMMESAKKNHKNALYKLVCEVHLIEWGFPSRLLNPVDS